MRIVLHIGAPKTGTSALQVALVRNRANLIERGIFYPQGRKDVPAAAGVPTNGNAVPLAKFLNPTIPVKEREWAPESFGKVLAAAEAATCKIVLFSSEFMSFFDADRMTAFVDHAAKREAEVEIVFFLRHIAGHALSAFDQAVKMKRHNGQFAEFVESGRYRPRFIEVINRCITIVGRERLKILVYDDVQSALLASLVDAIGCEVRGLTETAERINPSVGGYIISEL